MGLRTIPAAYSRIGFLIVLSFGFSLLIWSKQKENEEKEDSLQEVNVIRGLHILKSSPLQDTRVGLGRTSAHTVAPDVLDEEPTSSSHLLFGIASSLESWSSRGKFVRTWWNIHNVRGFVWLDALPSEILEMDPPFQVSGDIRHLHYHGKGLRSYLRLARVIKDAFMLNMPNVRWFVMGDDDTFFSPQGVTALLSKYDHNEMLYIGSQSETHWQNNVMSHEIAFGGGGFAISRPLAAALNHTLDSCMERYTELWGSDQRVGICIAELGVHVTRERGFHQCDLRGSIAGLFEAHPPEIFASLHHLQLLQPVLPHFNDQTVALQAFASAMQPDPVGFLQEAICYFQDTKAWTISIAWGYSVKVYPKILRFSGLERMERTFLTYSKESDPNSYDLNTRKVEAMASGDCGLPYVMYVDHVAARPDGSVASRYVRESKNRRHCAHRVASLNTITVVRSEPMQVNRRKAGLTVGPNLRRQCCHQMLLQNEDALTIWLDYCMPEHVVGPFE